MDFSQLSPGFLRTFAWISNRRVVNVEGTCCSHKSGAVVLSALIKLRRPEKFRAFAERFSTFYIFYQIEDGQHSTSGKVLLRMVGRALADELFDLAVAQMGHVVVKSVDKFEQSGSMENCKFRISSR